MTVISNDPSWLPLIDLSFFYSYWIVAAGIVVVYDWVLTLGQEIELIWTQHWSFMTVLYLVVHTLCWDTIFCDSGNQYVGPVDRCRVSVILPLDLARHNDSIGNIIIYAVNGTNVVVTAMLGAIMLARLYAMYQRSGRMLIFLVVIFLAVNTACGVIVIIAYKYYIGGAEELILSGIHMCADGSDEVLTSMIWMLNTIWEILALCLSVWIAAKHFRDLRRLNPLTGSTMGDCFRVLTESHVLYFASFAGVSCLQLIDTSPELENLNYIGVEILFGAMNILLSVQMFLLGPRLILSVRQFNAKLVAESDAETSMNSIVFQEHVHVPTSSTV
ncbi:uncharacterized protein HD556DRAFT_1442663 [Suillus plorans]|uniref:DUF6533 domain-containing protein n=1 Tax=Suillus plorans TaxID=116603 RepID=A0A9P7ARE2_9AGAM|nr:uncharacterized protein HD556DRAFT_1442663 [Suillus plorans]KAG1794877.1 hypothetical protein HD556DRAFT_1442663 [Suillus plorans]